MNLQASILRRRKHFGIGTLVLLLWITGIMTLIHLLHVPPFFNYLHPFAVMESFLMQWTEAAWIFPFLLLLLSLLGWLLANRNILVGRTLLIGTQCVILAADAIITPLHLMNAAGYFNWFGGKEPSTLGTVALLGLIEAVYPVVVLILTNKWKPNIK